MWVQRSKNNYAYAEEGGPRDEANIHVHIHVYVHAVEHVVTGIIRKTNLPAKVLNPRRYASREIRMRVHDKYQHAYISCTT